MRGRGLHATSLGSGAELPRNELIAALTPAEARALLYEWAFWARPNQLPPNGEWRGAAPACSSARRDEKTPRGRATAACARPTPTPDADRRRARARRPAPTPRAEKTR